MSASPGTSAHSGPEAGSTGSARLNGAPRVGAHPGPELVDELRAQVDQQLAQAWAPGTGTADVRTAVQKVLDRHAREAIRAGRVPLSAPVEAQVRAEVIAAVNGAGGLARLLGDPLVETININGADCVWVQRTDGTRVQADPVAASDAELAALVRSWAGASAQERRFDHGSPQVGLSLPGGVRVHALMDVTDRVCVSIRRHPSRHLGLNDLITNGTLSLGLAHVLAAMVRARINLVVAGGPASGKTTLLRALCEAIAPAERVITVEDVYELSLSRARHPDLVAMQARDANTEGAGAIDAAALLRACLRMSPDRVIVGEVRGAEVVQMAQAMNIGIDGSMATVHASSARQGLDRLIAYAMTPAAGYTHAAACALIAGSVHAVVHLQRHNGVRSVTSIAEVVPGDSSEQVIVTNQIYGPGPDGTCGFATIPRFLPALVTAGLDPSWWSQ